MADLVDCQKNENIEGKKTLSQHAQNNSLEGINELPPPLDRIIWRGSYGVTLIPESRLSDPFISAYVLYFNSRFFNESCKYPHLYVKAMESLLAILDEKVFQITPSNIFGFLLAYLKKNETSENKIYKVYTSARSVARREARGSWKGIKKKGYLLDLIEYSNEESLILREVDLQAPKLIPPNHKASPDIITKFNLDWDGDELLKSLRSFCIFYLNEWHKIRKCIFKKYPKEASELLNYHNKNERLLVHYGTSRQIGESGRHLSNIAFDIIKKINNPILNEYFSSAYLLAFSTGHAKIDNASQIIKEGYCHDSLTSTAYNLDWIKEINRQFINNKNGKLATPDWAERLLRKASNLSESKNYSIEPNWSGTLQSLPSIKDLLGMTVCEEICMAWLLGSDRHQPSNLAIFTVGDVAETDNSLTTIIDPMSYKGRSLRSAGTSYGQPLGEKYKKNTNMYKAISGYKSNLIRSYDMGFFKEHIKPEDGYLFPMIRYHQQKPRSDHLRYTYLVFNKKTFVNYGLKLCAMKGSVTNNYLLDNDPKSELFLKLIKHTYLLNLQDTKLNIGISVSIVARQAVNNLNASYYTPSAIPLSENNNIEISNSENEDKMEIDAAMHNHSLKTKLNIYSDKLPPYLAKSKSFSSRVGDEMVRLALKLEDSSEVLNISELRTTFGFSTTAEKEQSQLNNEINSVMSQALLLEYTLDDTGFMTSKVGKTIILRHPITIALIKGKINAIDNEINRLEYSNDNLLNNVLAKRMFLGLLLNEVFTPTEIRESDEIYADVVFPFSDILV